MLVSGMTAKSDEQCLVANGGSIKLESCMSATAAGDGREIFKFNEDGQVEHLDDGTCMVVAGGTPHDGGVVNLLPCKEALHKGDGISEWDITPSGQLKLQNDGNLCLMPVGSKMVVKECDQADQAADAEDKWFLSTPGDFNASSKLVLA